ncbi:hypothetical protein KFZ76_00990 [Methylovulum psychrotolerans]|uniref:hypothetical protein n=1 Tax=Methylovulum psychrotolerans TaxID=1704499 RepID=UPI001BFFCEA6|nr:hypothetical protein [Methylovulum psychrotolerans]MBT9096283.1 hypothetical protein [Methylovulum psychrotolerans]
MKLDIDFSGLEMLVKNMGASAVDWESNVTVTHVESDWKIILETTGLIVDINDVEIKPNGLLHYRGEQILLYIKEVNGFGHTENLPKFHFYQCKTLNAMKNNGRFERYVVTQRKTGFFLMDKKIGYNMYKKDVEEKLNVCKNCLNWYNNNYHKRYDINTFDINEFFKHFLKSPINVTPTYTDLNSPVSGYTSDWNNISLQIKENRNYICDECHIDLRLYKKLLHAHHVNGVKHDNRSSNLKVLCIECHANQPFHEHVRHPFSKEILLLQRIRKAKRH